MPNLKNEYIIEIKNATEKSADIFIYDEIGAGFWTEGITAKQFVDDLSKTSSKSLNVRINSPGGSVFDGLAIYNALKRYPGQVNVYVDGFAASIASIIALAGDSIKMADNSLFMIHNPWAGTTGTADDLRKAADTLDVIGESMIGIYMERFAGTREELIAALDAETWYTAEQAKELGFATEVYKSDMALAASFDFKGLGFRNPPQVSTEPTAFSTEIAETLQKETPLMSNIELDVRAVQDEVAELRRVVEAGTPAPVAHVPSFKSAAELLKGIARGEESAMAAYTGATTADSYLADGWVGDLTRIVDSPAILRGVFSTGVLPAEGNNIEYASLDSNTVQVTVQDAEGDDLDYGKIEISSKTAPVKTIGGYIQLTRQLIERSSVAYLEHSLRAQALKVGQRLEAQMLAAYNTAHGAQVTAGNVVVLPDSTPTYNDWLNVITDAAVKFQTLGLQIDALIVDTATFKSLAALEGADGRPMLLVQGNGNVVGTINPRGLVGNLAGIPIVLDPAISGEIAFVSSQALRQYVSPVVQLQDENVINLSKDFSVYAYVATANEIPAAIVPVVVD
jgi:ATP-dependent Clp endopeptidase proteolytic subunit ClpP/HK97 family phage major capsid protein